MKGKVKIKTKGNRDYVEVELEKDKGEVFAEIIEILSIPTYRDLDQPNELLSRLINCIPKKKILVKTNRMLLKEAKEFYYIIEAFINKNEFIVDRTKLKEVVMSNDMITNAGMMIDWRHNNEENYNRSLWEAFDSINKIVKNRNLSSFPTDAITLMTFILLQFEAVDRGNLFEDNIDFKKIVDGKTPSREFSMRDFNKKLLKKNERFIQGEIQNPTSISK